MGRKLSCSVHTRNVLNLFCIIPLIPIEGLFYLNKSIYNLLFLYLTVADALLILCMWITGFTRRKNVNIAAVFLFALAAVNIFLTIMKNGDKRGVFGVWLYSIPLIMLFETNRNNIYSFLKTVLFYLETLIIVNLVLVLLRPQGLFSSAYSEYGKMWILGYKSSLQCYVFPAVIISLLLFSYGKNTKNAIILLIISHVVCIAESNGMLLIGLAIMDAIFITKLYKRKVINRKLLFFSIIGIVIANIVIVLFTNAFLSNSAVQYITYSVLGKNSTLSMRTANWAAVWPAIKDSPLVGYGYTSSEVRTILYGRETAHAHNLFLELLYENGIAGLMIFATFNFVIIHKLSINIEKDSSKILFFALLVFYIMYIFENVFQKSSAFIWLIFMLAYYSKWIDEALSDSSLLHKLSLKG